MQPGDTVRLIANPTKVGIVGNETDGPAHRLRLLIKFLDGTQQYLLKGSLEKVEETLPGPYALMASGRYGRTSDLRGAVTFYRLTGRLANLIYSLNTTNTQFLPFQFKPVLQFLDSPCNGILIADEVGLGKTIEAGLIWTELRARIDAKRLLVLCPAMLREKWKLELANRFGVTSSIVGPDELLLRLKEAQRDPGSQFALVASLQGMRPPRGWNNEDDPATGHSAALARFLDATDFDEPLLDLVVIDEAHYLRNSTTQTHSFGTLIRQISHSFIMLSATPIQLRSTDLFTLLHLLDENAFPFEATFEQTLIANAPLVTLRDRILREVITAEELQSGLLEAKQHRMFADNAQIGHLIANPPGDDELASPRGRSEIADRLDRINPLTKVVARTLKRDVQELRVQRQPVTFRVKMSPLERRFYDEVTDAVREFCSRVDYAEGFMLTIPQRQMSSCLAAACGGWLEKASPAEGDEFEELLSAVFGEQDDSANKPRLGVLQKTLVQIANTVGDYRSLSANDSKLDMLISNLSAYWGKNPGKKVVLFSFYRNTLHYLADRLADAGIHSVIVHGGIDKQAAIEQFSSAHGPDLLLSSEVASEGVDLQFSSLLINYDLPWNPSKIEQRIGRIDRIGQEAERILIWNFIYDDTVDERVYERLLERLNVFRQALGSMEAMLGDEIRKLGYELLSHNLSPEEEATRIETAGLAIENLNRQQAVLDEQAMHLIAHGDYIQNKVKAARELGRYVRGDDLLAYVRDFFELEFPGTRLLSMDGEQLEHRIELSIEARKTFSDFLETHRLQGATRLLGIPAPTLIFENRLGKTSSSQERVTQDHPLIRFVSYALKNSGRGSRYFPVAAIELDRNTFGDMPPGIYVYAVARWSVSGARDIERLEYIAKAISNGQLIEGELAESMVTSAALNGADWLAARFILDHAAVAEIQEECRVAMERRFASFSDAQLRENQDRVNMMVIGLNQHLESQTKKLEDRVAAFRISGNKRKQQMIPALTGRIEKFRSRILQRIEELKLRSSIKSEDGFVSCGVIRIL